MSMKKLYADVEALVDKELLLANENNPPFSSPHEGYAVILEEVEEMQEAIRYVEDRMRGLWFGVKSNDKIWSDSHRIYIAALNAACEAIQVAAMCVKFKDLERGGEDAEG